MRVFKTKWFSRYAIQEGIDDDSLKDAIHRAEQGLVDADLGGGLIKMRVAKKGRGRSSGYRTLIAFKKKSRAVFLFGFAKNERANIEKDELLSFKEIAAAWNEVSDAKIGTSLSSGVLREVKYEKKS